MFDWGFYGTYFLMTSRLFFVGKKAALAKAASAKVKRL
jgi:hypothetical protein